MIDHDPDQERPELKGETVAETGPAENVISLNPDGPKSLPIKKPCGCNKKRPLPAKPLKP